MAKDLRPLIGFRVEPEIHEKWQQMLTAQRTTPHIAGNAFVEWLLSLDRLVQARVLGQLPMTSMEMSLLLIRALMPKDPTEFAAVLATLNAENRHADRMRPAAHTDQLEEREETQRRKGERKHK